MSISLIEIKAAAICIESKALLSKKTMNFLYFSNSTFIKCTAGFSSVILITGNYNVSISQSLFEKNNALLFEGNKNSKGNVAVFYFICQTHILCNLSIFNSTFKNNYAEIFIPTIFSEAYLTENHNILTNNSAGSFEMPYLSSFPLDIRLIYYEENEEFVSGEHFTVSFEITDHFGQRFLFDNSSIATISIFFQTNSSSLLNGVTQANMGFLNFSNLLIKHPPNSSILLYLSLKFTSFDKENLKIDKNFTFYSRKCMPGEILLSDFSCKKCPPYSFSLEDPMDINYFNQKCKYCPQHAECPGGDYIIPEAGYWRLDKTTTYIIPCLLKTACIGKNNLDLKNPTIYLDNDHLFTGICEEGHDGNLCHDCVLGYGKFTSGQNCSLEFFTYGFVLYICHYLSYDKYQKHYRSFFQCFRYDFEIIGEPLTKNHDHYWH